MNTGRRDFLTTSIKVISANNIVVKVSQISFTLYLLVECQEAFFDPMKAPHYSVPEQVSYNDRDPR